MQTHRDPLVALPSLVSLRTVLHSAFSARVDLCAIGRATTQSWAFPQRAIPVRLESVRSSRG
jgi:hypothetical protein